MTLVPSRRACAAVAIAAYLVVALVAFRNVLSSPSTLLPSPADIGQRHQLIGLDRWDQSMVLSTVVRNANLLASRPWDLFADVGQCYPMPRAYTLGEHMFGLGLLATVPYALSADPILTYNVVLILTLWIPAITMYFLALRFTRSPAAAFVAGLAFSLGPARLMNPAHPYVHGDLWAPAVLLFLHRLFVSGKWRDALGLALFLSLEVAESLYPLISTCLLGAVYGIYLLFRHPENLRKVAPRLLSALGLSATVAWIVLGPYLETGDTWSLLSGRTSRLLTPSDFYFGNYFHGFLVLAGVVVALVDRLRGPRLVYAEDPRLAFLVGGILLAWIAVGHTVIPGLDFAIESPFLLLRGIVPGLEAVRGLGTVAIGTGITTSFLVGYAVLALVERLRPAPWAAVAGAAVCAVALLAMRFVPSLAQASFGRTFRYTTFEARPAQEDIDLLRRVGKGPLVDVPLGTRDGHTRLDIADALLLASYDPRPLAACYNSFQAPVNAQMIALSAQLPSPGATEALGALGFETVFLHRGRAGLRQARAFEQTWSADAETRRRLQPLGGTEQIAAYRIAPQEPFATDFGMLGPSDTDDVLEALIPRARIDFPIANRGGQTFRHPDPLEPTDLVVRWHDTSGHLAHEEATRALLPIALGSGGVLPVVIEVTTPESPGNYVATISRADAPDRVIGSRKLHLPRLEDVMTPAEIAMHLHRDFVNQELIAAGAQTVFPPADDTEMLLAPGVTGAADLRAHGRLAAHWLGSAEEPSSTLVIDADVRPWVAGRVHLRQPIPERAGFQVVLITPIDDPTTLLAARVLFPDLEGRAEGRAEGPRAVEPFP